MEQAEQMCDSICLVNRGRDIVSGPLRDVKRNFMQGLGERQTEGLNEKQAEFAQFFIESTFGITIPF